MQIIETLNIKVSPETNRKRHKQYKNVRSDFIASCGEHFAKRDKLPTGYDIHHIIPLSMKEGNSDFDNMCIISRRFHNYINDTIYEPQVGSKEKYCYFPKFKRVVDDNEKAELFEYLQQRRIK